MATQRRRCTRWRGWLWWHRCGWFSSGQQGHRTKPVALGTGNSSTKRFQSGSTVVLGALPVQVTACRALARSMRVFPARADFERQSPGARYPDASPLGTVRCDALRISDRPGTGDGGTVATEAPARDNSSLLREKESARPRRAPFYMVSSMIAFTMSPSFARSALTALDREQDAWDMTSSTSSSRDMWHENM